MVRLSVETMPSVTVPVRPSGEPIATAVSPTLSLPESPRVAGTSPVGLSILITARSDSGSVPTILAVKTLPSLVRTSTAAFAVLPSRVTTCVLVSTCPSPSRTMPEPVPPLLPLVALMVTTLGEALTAAAVMALTSSLLLTITVPGWPVLPVEVSGRFPSRALLPATTPPPTRPAARMLAMRVGTPKAALRFGRCRVPNEFWGPGPVGGWLPYPP